jgi:hypothetical protein
MTDAGFRNVMPVGYDAPLPSKEEWEMKDVEVDVSDDVRGSSAVALHSADADMDAADRGADAELLTVEQAKTLAKLIVLYPWLERLL